MPRSCFAAAAFLGTIIAGRNLAEVSRRSHFVVFRFEGLDLAINPMLAGRFRLGEAGEPDEKSLGFALGFGEIELRYLDDKKMGKAYLIATDDWKAVPGMQTGGVDILSSGFTPERFVSLLKHRRDQVRRFLMDKKALDSLGNAYTDEVLFEAGIHPKTFCRNLSHDDGIRLHGAIVKVLKEAVAEVEGSPSRSRITCRIGTCVLPVAIRRGEIVRYVTPGREVRQFNDLDGTAFFVEGGCCGDCVLSSGRIVVR